MKRWSCYHGDDVNFNNCTFAAAYDGLSVAVLAVHLVLLLGML